MPGKWAEIIPRAGVRVTRAAGSGQHLASLLQESQENANIDAGLGFIWRISDNALAGAGVLALACGLACGPDWRAPLVSPPWYQLAPTPAPPAERHLVNPLNIVIVTATVTPKPGVPNLRRSDPALRLQDYSKSFESYLTLLDANVDFIIFCDNSSSDISILKQTASEKGRKDRVEFISFDGLNYPPDYDRAYGEFMLIDYVMDHSDIISNRIPKETVFWKVTGRYIVRNLDSIIANQPRSFDLYCNFKNFRRKQADSQLFGWTWRGYERRKQTDLFLFAWTARGYEVYLRNTYPKLRMNAEHRKLKIDLEELWRDLLDSMDHLNSIKLVRRFNVVPQLEGFRAADNKAYHVEGRWNYRFRRIGRVVTPWLWI